MRIEIIKKYAIHVKELKKGTQLRVRKWLGEELIKKGVAIELDVEINEEIVETAIQEFFDEAEVADDIKQSLPKKKNKSK
jgi:hypothetical protein